MNMDHILMKMNGLIKYFDMLNDLETKLIIRS